MRANGPNAPILSPPIAPVGCNDSNRMKQPTLPAVKRPTSSPSLLAPVPPPRHGASVTDAHLNTTYSNHPPKPGASLVEPSSTTGFLPSKPISKSISTPSSPTSSPLLRHQPDPRAKKNQPSLARRHLPLAPLLPKAHDQPSRQRLPPSVPPTKPRNANSFKLRKQKEVKMDEKGARPDGVKEENRMRARAALANRTVVLRQQALFNHQRQEREKLQRRLKRSNRLNPSYASYLTELDKAEDAYGTQLQRWSREQDGSTTELSSSPCFSSSDSFNQRKSSAKTIDRLYRNIARTEGTYLAASGSNRSRAPQTLPSTVKVATKANVSKATAKEVAKPPPAQNKSSFFNRLATAKRPYKASDEQVLKQKHLSKMAKLNQIGSPTKSGERLFQHRTKKEGATKQLKAREEESNKEMSNNKYVTISRSHQDPVFLAQSMREASCTGLTLGFYEIAFRRILNQRGFTAIPLANASWNVANELAAIAKLGQSIIWGQSFFFVPHPSLVGQVPKQYSRLSSLPPPVPVDVPTSMSKKFELSKVDTTVVPRKIVCHRRLHLESVKHIANKSSLCEMIRQLHVQWGNVYAFHPLTYVLPRDLSLLLQQHSASNSGFVGNVSFICKESEGQCGEGIVIVSSPNAIRKLRCGPKMEVVAQQYLDKPMLVGGYKFDMRLYVVIEHTRPLRVFLFRDGLVRFSTKKYDNTNLKDSFTHLTNTSINFHSNSYTEVKNVIGVGCVWRLKRLLTYLHRQKGVDVPELWRKIVELVTLTVLAIFDRFAPRPYDQHAKRFQHIGVDVLIDEDHKPWLLEVNQRPHVKITCDVEQQVKVPLFKGLMDLLGMTGFPSREGGEEATVEGREKLELRDPFEVIPIPNPPPLPRHFLDKEAAKEEQDRKQMQKLQEKERNVKKRQKAQAAKWNPYAGLSQLPKKPHVSIFTRNREPAEFPDSDGLDKVRERLEKLPQLKFDAEVVQRMFAERCNALQVKNCSGESCKGNHAPPAVPMKTTPGSKNSKKKNSSGVFQEEDYEMPTPEHGAMKGSGAQDWQCIFPLVPQNAIISKVLLDLEHEFLPSPPALMSGSNGALGWCKNLISKEADQSINASLGEGKAKGTDDSVSVKSSTAPAASIQSRRPPWANKLDNLLQSEAKRLHIKAIRERIRGHKSKKATCSDKK